MAVDGCELVAPRGCASQDETGSRQQDGEKWETNLTNATRGAGNNCNKVEESVIVWMIHLEAGLKL